MNTIELNCPCCGANIHVDENLVAFDCPNCGNRIVLTEQPDPSVTRSIPTKRPSEQFSSPKKQRSPLRGVVAAILAVAVIVGAGFVGTEVYAENQIAKSKESVWEYIDHKDFTRARSELGTRFESHWFYKEKWETAGMRLLEEIDKKEQEYKQEQIKEEERKEQEEKERKEQEEKERKELEEKEEKEAAIEAAKEQNAYYPVPMDRKEAVGKNVDEVKRLFIEAKFINFSDKPIKKVDAKEAKKAEDGNIKSLSIKVDGKEISPKKEETVRGDAEIIIEYYDFSKSSAVPMSASEAKKMDGNEVKEAFEQAGFSNVFLVVYEKQEDNVNKGLVRNISEKAENVKDTVGGFIFGDSSGKVHGISIQESGKETENFKEGAIFPSDSVITITYYE